MGTWILRCRDDDIHIRGDIPSPGMRLPSFMLVNEQFHDVPLEHFRDRKKIIMSVMSIELVDSARLVDELRSALKARNLTNTAIIIISADLPLAQHRCAVARGWAGVTLLSTLRGRDFHKDYGVLITDYPFAGLTGPALWVAGGDDTVLYAERLANTEGSFDWESVADWA